MKLLGFVLCAAALLMGGGCGASALGLDGDEEIPQVEYTRESEITSLCGAEVTQNLVLRGNLEEITWASDQIVVATVSGRVRSLLGDLRSTGDPSLGETQDRPILTEYAVQVDSRLRGTEEDELVIRIPGGTLEGCTQYNVDWPQFESGDQALMFLRWTGEVFELTAGPFAYWEHVGDGIRPYYLSDLLLPEDVESVPFEEVAADVLATLHAGIPQIADGADESVVVSNGDAPPAGEIPDVQFVAPVDGHDDDEGHP